MCPSRPSFDLVHRIPSGFVDVSNITDSVAPKEIVDYGNRCLFGDFCARMALPPFDGGVGQKTGSPRVVNIFFVSYILKILNGVVSFHTVFVINKKTPGRSEKSFCNKSVNGIRCLPARPSSVKILECYRQVSSTCSVLFQKFRVCLSSLYKRPDATGRRNFVKALKAYDRLPIFHDAFSLTETSVKIAAKKEKVKSHAMQPRNTPRTYA